MYYGIEVKILLHCVSNAAVSIDGVTVASIERGLLLLVGFGLDDSGSVVAPMANKIINMRVLPDDSGRFSYSLLGARGRVLLVPQFKLYADTRKGRRPAAASALFDEFTDTMQEAIPG